MSIDVGVGQLVEELEQRGDRLPFEIGAFVARYTPPETGAYAFFALIAMLTAARSSLEVDVLWSRIEATR